MKKILLASLAFLSVQLVMAQFTFSGNNIFNTNSGNVGIGETLPQAKLDVSGNARFLTGEHQIYINSYIDFDPNLAGIRVNSGHMVLNAKSNGVIYINRDVVGDTRIQSNQVDIAVFNRNGTVGIGVVNTGSFKLAVEGKIGAREVHVTLANPWPDYVFKTDYKLMSLEEVREFIKTNHHLPDMPPAAEVEKNGIDLGDLNAKLLRKVEELTLYMIELKEENEKIKEELQKLKVQK
jgi:hypothetical protein